MICVRKEHEHLLPRLSRLAELARIVVETPRADAYEASIVLCDALKEEGVILDPRRHDPVDALWHNDSPDKGARMQEWDRAWATRWAFRWVYGADRVDSESIGMGPIALRDERKSKGDPHGQFMRMTLQRLDGTAPEQRPSKPKK